MPPRFAVRSTMGFAQNGHAGSATGFKAVGASAFLRDLSPLPRPVRAFLIMT